ncbi:MAG: UDP-N-acetylglucosamine 2-epimerase (non-hydrolyzing) [Chloroflexi bacterium]|nr:UDP-N-acetylglucosamine 2-epimerase (non-hydrolyzing) [Chloroflexota bacterium]
MRVMHIVGARPNFMKVAPVIRAMSAYPRLFQQVLVHTGQHYDYQMSTLFFEELHLPKPDHNLEVGSGPHGAQTGKMLAEAEKVMQEEKPDWLFVYGDTNSALAGSLAATKLHIRVAHVEAGLRSFDRAMPEEINRIVTDQVSDLLFTPSQDGNDNLEREGIERGKIHLVGNVMIDSLALAIAQAERFAHLRAPGLSELMERLEGQRYVLVTLHRPSNVDESSALSKILSALVAVSKRNQVVFPVHPRTQQRMKALGPEQWPDSLHLLEPLGYFDFLALMRKAAVMVTDSGGVQEETTYLGVPCLTVRPNTERPITITCGTNRLSPLGGEALGAAINEALDARGSGDCKGPPPLWDGHAAERIVEVMVGL